MNSGRKAVVFLVLLAAVSAGNREVDAQQNQASAIASQIREGLAECNRKYPDEVKQAVANTMCEKQAMEPLKRTSPYPDLVDLETTNALVVAEKLQKGKMTLIEAKAAVAQIHSDVVAEFQRRQLAKAAVAQQRPSPAQTQAPSTVIIDNSSPPVFQSDAPKLQNIIPPPTRCQTMRVGMMLQTMCN